MRFFSKFFKSEEAVAAVEFAIIAPLVLLFMLGIFNFGFYINASMKVEALTRAAAEYILKGGDVDLIQQDIVEQSNIGLTNAQLASISTEATLTCECRGGGKVECAETNICGEDDYTHSFVTVQMTMPYNSLLPSQGMAESMTVRGRVRLQIE